MTTGSKSTPKSPSGKSDRGNFFAVDRRAWNQVCTLGMNAAVAYLVLARGTGGDNRTTKWSTNAIEQYTGISRSRAKAAIQTLEVTGIVHRVSEQKSSRPMYKLVAAHEITGTEGHLPLNGRQEPKPEWIWLPNALIDGTSPEHAPVELVRQTGSIISLQLLVNLYGSQNLDENGGIHFRELRQDYTRHQIGRHGSYIIWGFSSPDTRTACPSAPFILPLTVHKNEGQEQEKAWVEFSKCLQRLEALGLLETVIHLVESDDENGEIIHAIARPGTGTKEEQGIGRAALRASRTLISPHQLAQAQAQNIEFMAPVRAHIEGVQAVGISRLFHKPRTAKTKSFLAKKGENKEIIARLNGLSNERLATSRGDQRTSKKPCSPDIDTESVSISNRKNRKKPKPKPKRVLMKQKGTGHRVRLTRAARYYPHDPCEHDDDCHTSEGENERLADNVINLDDYRLAKQQRSSRAT